MGAPQAHDISVVVCAYADERWSDLIAAVESVRAQTVRPSEIVVVVDGNDRLRARAAARWEDAVVVANSDERGLSGARNTGVGVSHGTILAFLDDDAVAAPDWLERLCRGYEDPAVLGVGGAVKPLWVRGRPAWFPPEFDWVVGCSHSGMPDAPRPVRNLVGANMSFRRDVFAVAGGFRNELGRVGRHPAGCEETELCIRANAARRGGKILYDPTAVVRHRVTRERQTLRYFSRRCYAEGRSKALLARIAGVRAALGAEQAYVRRTLPLAFLRSVRAAVAQRETGALRRAGTMVIGLALTLAGYAVGLSSRGSSAAAGVVKR
jgi:GT2 family glycosyltransferase